jgi:hypothetical protein
MPSYVEENNSPYIDGAFISTDYAITASDTVYNQAYATTDHLLCDQDLIWFANSGVTRHMTGHIAWFSDLTTIPNEQWPIKGIGPRIIYAKGIGTINIDRYINNEWQSGSIQEVL